MTCPKHWQCFESPEQLAWVCAQEILATAEEAIHQRGRFDFVVSGGRTPIATYQHLCQAQSDWSKWHIYLGDERCLPAADPERNSYAIEQAWLHFGKIPKDQIHFIPTELGAEIARTHYEKVVQAVDWFDLTLLGMGEDGHTASLFPGHEYPVNESVVIERNSPKPPPERVTLSFLRLNQSRVVLKQITGASKRQAVAKWLAGEKLPIESISGMETTVFISKEALPETT